MVGHDLARGLHQAERRRASTARSAAAAAARSARPRKDEDFVEHLFVASTHAYILFFTTTGKVYWLKVHEIPQAGRAARGKAIVNLLNLRAGREGLGVPAGARVPGRAATSLFATSAGTVKKTDAR